jgi:hypothetical protein
MTVSSAMSVDGVTHCNMEASRSMNRTKYFYSSIIEVTYEKNEESMGAFGNNSQEPGGAMEFWVSTQ